MKLIDCHAHLDQIENIDEVLAQSAAAGVEAIVAVGVDLNSSRKNLELSRRITKPKIYVGLGIHPGEIKPEENDAALNFFEENIQAACAIGEIGLDFWYRWVRKDNEKKEAQRIIFRRQLELAKKYERPVIIHSRGAWDECFEMLASYGPRRALFHWYSGPLDILKKILERGYCISATPALAYSPPLQDAMREAPIEQVLMETDCPVFFRASESDAGFRSTPKDVVRTIEAYANLRQMELTEVTGIFNSNAQKFFNLELRISQ